MEAAGNMEFPGRGNHTEDILHMFQIFTSTEEGKREEPVCREVFSSFALFLPHFQEYDFYIKLSYNN